MGNDYQICNNSRTIETNLCVEKTQVTQVAPLPQPVRKTLYQFISDNGDFFNQDGTAIVHIFLSQLDFEQHINKFSLESITQSKRVFMPEFTNEEFTVYQGQCLFLDFKNCQLYLGLVSNGNKQGQGVLISKNGNSYRGKWNQNKQNGYGVLEILYPKRSYKGLWKNGKLQGPGQATYEDGAKYQGHFFQGKKHGFGILTFYDGAVYEGSFQDDLMHGFGTLTSTKGRQITGEWKHGKYQATRFERSSKTFSINQLPAI